MRELKFVVTILSCLIFLMGYQLQAQVLDKGVTSSGKEVDCSTIDPSVDKTITEHGKIVTSPRVTRNGKIITEECSTCGIELSITDTVNCTSITLYAVITAGDPTAATLKVYRDAAHATQVGGNITATIAGTEITVVANNLNCHTRYYFVLEAIEGTETCTFDWTDSTRDMTPIAPTSCLVSNILSNEHESATGVIDSVRDHEGNAYSVVQIGEQCWLKQNMRAITTPSGKTLALADKDHPYTSSTSSVPTYFINNTTNGAADFYDIYGCLYNWVAAMDTTAYGNNHLLSAQYPYRGICPEGWHIPADDEFTTMANYVVSDNHYGENVVPNYAFGTKTQQYEGANTHISSMLGTDCWQTSTVDKSIGKLDTFRNKTSFSALPSGFWYNGSFDNYLQRSYFWTSSESDATHAYRHYIVYNQAGFSRNNDYTKNNVAQGVRCVRDVQLDLGNITLDTVACTFIDVKAPLLSAKTSQLTYDVKAYTDDTYTVVAGASQVTINATKDTIFAHISNLEGNTHYYIRATAIEGALEDTSYFEESTHCMCKVYRPLVQEDPVNFRNYEWGHEANGIVYVDSVADHEGNRYSVCEVGPQCWIRENVRVTTSPSTGESILATSSTNCDKMPQARWQTWITDSATRVLVGPVYNWPAMVDYGVTSGNPDVPEWYNNRKGLCPAGWHLQHSDEFDKVLVPNLGGNNEVVVRLCGGPVGSHSGDTDADGYLWKEYTGVNDLHAGAVNNPKRNSSALTFRACGQWCSDQGFNHRHAYHFSSANQTAATTFKYYWIQPANTTIETGNDAKSHSHSMRCIRDGEISFSELVIDTLSCTTAKFHAKYNNGVLDSVVVSKIKAGASTSTEFIQNNKAASVRVSNDTVYAEITNLDCSKDYTTFYIKVFDEEYESYVAKATVDRDPKSSASRPCAVASARGNEISNAANQIDSVSDHENNTYAVVQIGELCWMKENLRTQSSPSGKTITKGANNSTDDVQHYYISTNVNSEEENYAEFGCLYNWAALMDTTSGKVLYNINDIRRGICPEGWHVPSETDWANLEQQIANTTLAASDFTRTNYSSKLDAGRLAASCDWGAVKTALTNPACYNLPERNSTLFSALPGGSKTSSSFTGVNANTIFWSAAEKDNDEACIRQLASATNGVERSYMSKYQNAAYVRCVRDIEPEFTNLETTEVTCSSVHFTAKMSQGLVGYNANVVVSTQSDFSDTVTAQSLIIPADSIVIADFYDLKTNTQYFIKVDNDATDFTTELCACTVSSIDAENEHATDGKVYEVKDVDGNWYGVIQIGNQCWTRQNMRCTTSPSTGTSIVANNYYSTISKSAKWYGNDSTQYASYGLLYNACAALDMTRQTTDPEVASANSTTGWAYTAPDGFVQGICPAGWHVPSDAEWTTMENYVVTDNHYGVSLTASPVFGTQSNTAFPTDYAREGTNTPVSPMLAYPMTWTSNNTSNATASAYVYRDTTQFDAKAAGYFTNSNTAAGIGTYAAFWTATPNANNMIIRQMHNSAAGISRLNVAKSYDISVRCVRDVFHPEMSICEDTTFGTVMLKEVKDVAKVEFIKDGTVKKTIDNPASNVSVNDLPEGIYQVNAISPHRDTIVDNARVKHTYTHCTVGSLLSNEMGATTTQLDSVKDHQNNWYEVVQIGNQCWLKENMRTSQTNTGTDLTNQTGTTNKSTTDKYYYVPNQADRYGYFYNYPAANSICPSGWHLPTDDEWKTMVEAAGVTDNNTTTGTGLGKLVTSCDWPSLTGDASDPRPGNYEYAERNLSGFSALPAGEWNDDFFADGAAAEFWTATKSGSDAWYRGMGNTDKGTHRYAYQLFRAYSVRCVRDIPVTVTISFDANGGSGSMDAMHVITLADTVLNANTFTREGYFEFAGWNTDRFGQGTAYADRAHIASSESITLYAQWNTYCASAPRANERGTGRVDTVMDHEDNRYNVVQVGPQCWIRENLVTQTSPSTGEMLVSTTMTGTDRARKAAWFRNNETRYAQAGLLYNWCSIVDYADPNTSDFEWYENHQGICPTGWHAFSTDEWQVLTNTTTASELLVRTCGGPTSTSAADDTLWLYKSANGYPGSLNDSRRNSTGLSFIPAGHWYPSEFALDGSLHFYSVNQSSADRVTFYHIDPEKTTLTTGTEEKTHYHAARCIRDGLTTFSEITVDSISCAYVSFHATMHNGKNIDTKNAGASTHADYIKSKVAGVVDSTSVVAGDTVIYAHVSFQAANCGHTFYIYLQGQDGVDKQLYGVRKAVTLSDPEVKKATSCTVLTLNAGQDLGSGKYANREWSTDGTAPFRLDSISDHEGNVYRVVEMGNACWMKENMRARTQTDGTDIFSTAVTNSTAEGQKAYINTTSTGDPDFYEKYGCLYNWIAAMNLPSTNNNTLANPAQPHRGICPEGWHVPTVEEVGTMAAYAISSCASVTGDGTPSPAFTTTTTDQWYASNTYVGQILSGGCDWTDLSNGKQVNPMKPYLNLSGLSLLPARSVDNGTRAQVGLYAALWTASEVSTTQARYFATSSQSSGIELRGANKYGNARSVRCVRDEEIVDTITFVPNGGTGTMAKQMVVRGVATAINANAYTHTGNWSFVGWDTINRGDYIYEDQEEITTNGNIILCAQWHTSCKGTPGTNERGSSNVVDSVEDHEHNWYEVVQIGDQCWLKENMRAQTSPSTGTTILNIPASSSETGKRAYYYDNNPANANNGYGLLYNWFAAMDTSYVEFGETDADYLGQKRFYGGDYNGYRRGVCPEGWHLPADYEWTQLSNYVKSQPAYNKLDPYCESGEWITCGIGKSLASSSGWESEWTPDCDDELYSNTVICNQLGNNATGFTAVPAGRYVDGFNEYGEKAAFWTASPESAADYPFFRWIVSDKSYLLREATSASVGYSVRCVRNKFGEVTKTASTESSLSISVDYCIDNTVTSATLCAYTNAEGTQPEDGISTNTANITESTISGTITGLTAGTYYYVKVTATTNRGVESTKVTGPFITDGVSTPTDGQPCPGTPTVNDHEGNVYNTVQIGTQCWTKENMRCTTSPSTGATILISSTDGISSISGKQAWYYNNQPATADNGYGLLYNWCAAVDTFNTAYGELSTIVEPESAAPDVTFSTHRRGICPDGWHVPSDEEWTRLTSYVKSQNRYICDDCAETDEDGYTYCINKALASTTDFYVNNTILLYEGNDMCYPFYKLRYNNATGFSALLTYERGANFWSTSQQNPNDIYCRKIYSGEYYSSANYVERNTQPVSSAFSVRCLRDN